MSDHYFALAQRLGAQRDQLLAEVERLRAELDRAYGRLEGRDARLDAANALLERIVKYAGEDRARTPGTTRLARALDEVTAHLAAQPAVKP